MKLSLITLVFMISLQPMTSFAGGEDKAFNQALNKLTFCYSWSRVFGNYNTNGFVYATFPILPADAIGIQLRNRKLKKTLKNNELTREQVLQLVDRYVDETSWEENYEDEAKSLAELVAQKDHMCNARATKLQRLILD